MYFVVRLAMVFLVGFYVTNILIHYNFVLQANRFSLLAIRLAPSEWRKAKGE
jgi:hypothetical protein